MRVIVYTSAIDTTHTLLLFCRQILKMLCGTIFTFVVMLALKKQMIEQIKSICKPMDRLNTCTTEKKYVQAQPPHLKGGMWVP